MQYIPFVVYELLFIFAILLLYGIYKLCKSDEERPSSPTQTRPSFVGTSYRSPSENQSTDLTQSGLETSDRSSSPIGGSCLHCGTVITEETSLHCPACGQEHQRCPICQRFVAGGQYLLACPYCQMLGHANEMEEWVQKRSKCPHCAKKLMVHQLRKQDQFKIKSKRA
ncbi:MAG: hypothetical protein ACFE89_09620 [Candidatus Hodarchaeota archaeon]